jgi:hypothetical protein
VAEALGVPAAGLAVASSGSGTTVTCTVTDGSATLLTATITSFASSAAAQERAAALGGSAGRTLVLVRGTLVVELRATAAAGDQAPDGLRTLADGVP